MRGAGEGGEAAVLAYQCGLGELYAGLMPCGAAQRRRNPDEGELLCDGD